MNKMRKPRKYSQKRVKFYAIEVTQSANNNGNPYSDQSKRQRDEQVQKELFDQYLRKGMTQNANQIPQ